MDVMNVDEGIADSPSRIREVQTLCDDAAQLENRAQTLLFAPDAAKPQAWGPVLQQLSFVRSELQLCEKLLNREKAVNLGVFGSTGCGKSYMINYLSMGPDAVYSAQRVGSRASLCKFPCRFGAARMANLRVTRYPTTVESVLEDLSGSLQVEYLTSAEFSLKLAKIGFVRGSSVVHRYLREWEEMRMRDDGHADSQLKDPQEAALQSRNSVPVLSSTEVEDGDGGTISLPPYSWAQLVDHRTGEPSDAIVPKDFWEWVAENPSPPVPSQDDDGDVSMGVEDEGERAGLRPINWAEVWELAIFRARARVPERDLWRPCQNKTRSILQDLGIALTDLPGDEDPNPEVQCRNVASIRPLLPFLDVVLCVFPERPMIYPEVIVRLVECGLLEEKRKLEQHPELQWHLPHLAFVYNSRYQVSHDLTAVDLLFEATLIRDVGELTQAFLLPSLLSAFNVKLPEWVEGKEEGLSSPGVPESRGGRWSQLSEVILYRSALELARNAGAWIFFNHPELTHRGHVEGVEYGYNSLLKLEQLVEMARNQSLIENRLNQASYALERWSVMIRPILLRAVRDLRRKERTRDANELDSAATVKRQSLSPTTVAATVTVLISHILDSHRFSAQQSQTATKKSTSVTVGLRQVWQQRRKIKEFWRKNICRYKRWLEGKERE